MNDAHRNGVWKRWAVVALVIIGVGWYLWHGFDLAAQEFPWLAEALATYKWMLWIAAVFFLALAAAALYSHEHIYQKHHEQPRITTIDSPRSESTRKQEEDYSIWTQAFWAKLVRDHWRALLVIFLSGLLVPLVIATKESHEKKIKAEKQRAEYAAKLAETWSDLRSALTEFATNCGNAPTEPCSAIETRITQAYVRLSWVVPIYIQEVFANTCSRLPHENSDYAMELKAACRLIGGPAAMARTSFAYRKFLYAYAGLEDEGKPLPMEEALRDFLARTRELGCALVFAGSYQPNGSTSAPKLKALASEFGIPEGELGAPPACYCRKFLLAEAAARRSADGCTQRECGMDQSGDERLKIEDLMQQRLASQQSEH